MSGLLHLHLATWSLLNQSKIEQSSLLFKREFLKQYLTEKQNGYFQSGRLREVVAYEKWLLGES